MDAMLRLIGVLVLAAGITAEVAGTIPAPGIALVLGTCLAIYRCKYAGKFSFYRRC